MNIPSNTAKKFRRHIFLWWEDHRRDLPWRYTSDPYRILVSEIMLQQTQVSRVIAKYTEFLEKFPDASALAGASPADVIRLWKGLGYNRRALYLHKTAIILCDTYNGRFPINYEQLSKLPGLGTYTARALLVFAYKKNIALIDTNIRRIITHYFFCDIPQPEYKIQHMADQLLPKGKAWEWHQALMDYGALALPKLKTQNLKLNDQNKNKIPFHETDRFYRGRIVDRLREENIKESQLLKDLLKQYKKSKNSIRIIIQDLEQDGLIARTKGNMLSLPS